MNKRIRIKDIAERAGVSTGTVDRVLHKRGNVSQKAKEKVLAVMKDLDYEPNIIASTLALNRTLRIDSLLPDFTTDVYWQQPKLGMEKALQAVQHYGIINRPYYFDLFDTISFKKAVKKILDDPPEAILFAPIFLEESMKLLEECARRKIPVAMINTDIRNVKSLCYVGQDSYHSGVLGGKLLDFGLNEGEAAMILNLGKETSNAKHVINKEQGFRDYFTQNSSKNIEIVKSAFEDFDQQEELKNYIMEQLRTHQHVRGIFVINSRAYKLINCMESAALKNIKIVGFDLIQPNLEYLQQNKISFLINQNPVQQGYLGIMNIVGHLLFKKEVEPIQYLPLDIIVNENVEYYLQRELQFDLVI
ncbi:MAG: transcriptional regulator [Saprospiraceae bacterium]|nr:MAG: transcriptional regulator [Saprospiraceae bacterium]